MSFFFAKASKGPEAAPSKPKALGAPRSARANVAAVSRLGCLACPLNNAPGIVTPKMPPTLGEGGIYFLAEAPGKEDDENAGQPLTGPPGALLRQCIRDSSVSVPSFDNVINCFPGDTKVVPGGSINKVYRRQYKGPLIVVETVGGNHLSGTPNHPILTPLGWIPLKVLQYGSELFSSRDPNWMKGGNPYIKNIPSTFLEIFNAFSKSAISIGVVGGSMDFHGDGSNREINVLEPTGSLLPELNTSFFEEISENNFIRADTIRNNFKILSPPDSHFSDMTLGGPESLLTKCISIGPRPEFNPSIENKSFDCLSGNSILHRQEAKTFTTFIESDKFIDKVIRISSIDFEGHVFNLETESGGYVANGIHVSNCCPPGNRTPVWNEVEACRPRRIKWIEQQKPKLIVGLGVIPLHFMLHSTDMSGMRGRLFAVKVGNHRCWFMPTYHPSFILKTAYDKRKPLNSKLGHCFRTDVKRACEIADKLEPPVIESEQQIRSGVEYYDGSSQDHYGRLCTLLDLAREAKVKAVDIETQGLRSFGKGAKLLTIAFSFGTTNFAFAFNHPKAQWGVQERTEIQRCVQRILQDGTLKIAHNAPFEIEWFIQSFGKEVVNHQAWECTMMQAHFLDERKGKQGGGKAPYQSLDFLCKQHFGVAYKSMFKLNKKDMGSGDLNEVLVYNAVDTKYTLRLWKRQTKLLKEQGLYDAYLEALPRQPTVALMQYMGIGVNQSEIAELQIKLEGPIKHLEMQINLLPDVRAFKTKTGNFNPLSQTDLINFFKELNFGLKNDEGKLSVDKEILEGIDHPLANLIIELRNKTKLKSTYVDCFELGKGDFIWPDGLIHTSFNTTFTETGRLSCVAPWTPILTKRGFVPINTIQNGDYVWTHKKRWRKVLAAFSKGFEQMYDLHLANGQILTCTKNHRLLLSDNIWKTVGEICGCLEMVDLAGSEYTGGIKSLPEQRTETGGSNSKGPANNDFQHMVGHQKLYGGERTKSSTEIALLSIKDGHKESHAGEVVGKTPWLERTMRGWLWLLNHKNPIWQNICASQSNDRCIGIEENTQGVGGSPHRWEWKEQLFGQFGPNHETRASRYSQTSTSGLKVLKIEKVELSRSCEVFDLTVDEDSSYESCGVFSHNSDQPNQQNWPKRRDSWVRKSVIAPKGYSILAFDYGQLEGCTAAMCSKDKTLVKALWESYDIHLEWAQKTAALYPDIIGGPEVLSDKAELKKFRSVIKNKLVFPAIFGASNESIAGYLQIPLHIVNKIMQEFWATFTGLGEWQSALMKTYYEAGWVASPTGRLRRYPLTKNQVINFPVQSVAADIVCDAMNALSEHAVQTRQWHLHPILNVHDDLTFVVPDSLIPESVETIVKTMLTPDYDFINVPLSVEVSEGKNWFEMRELAKFFSNEAL